MGNDVLSVYSDKWRPLQQKILALAKESGNTNIVPLLDIIGEDASEGKYYSQSTVVFKL